jgi:2,5-furandicarboxylate decarboxylase 1
MDTPLPKQLDTRFRSALQRLRSAGRLKVVTRRVTTELEIAGLMKIHDGAQALLFTAIDGHEIPVLGNFLCCQANCEASFGIDYRGIRQLVGRALANPLEPRLVERGPVYEKSWTEGFDIGRALPVLRHAASDSGRFITAGVVIVRDPETGVYNASYHRLQLAGPNRTALKLDVGRHLRLAVERAARRGTPLPIAVCLGTDLALLYTAATMGSQMPESASELAAAGGLCGQPIPVVRALTQDLLVPAETEIVLEGVVRPDVSMREGPFGEFAGFSAAEDEAPVFEITALAHREHPVYHAMNGYGRETVMLRKYVLEATPQQEGLQRNVMMAAFGALKDLDLVIVVDDDIDIRDPVDVEYALATRMEASRDLVVVPQARSHEIARVTNNGIRAKLGIDATVPVEEQERFRRMKFAPVAQLADNELAEAVPDSLAWLG